MTAAGLEARYRRLLGWFPAEHRTAHGEEMLGVLMAGAGPQQRRPAAAEAADLFLSAARIRLRPGRALTDRDGWRDALAIFSLTAPILVFASVVLAYLAVDAWALADGVPAGALADTAGNPIFSLVVFGQVLMVPLVMLGLRRWAVAAALVQVLLIGYLAARAIPYGSDVVYVFAASYQVVLITETVALLASPGPRRGRQLLSRRHWALLGAVAVPAAAIVLPFSYARELEMLGWIQARLIAGPDLYVTADDKVLQLTGAALIGVALLAAWLSSANGKRLALLFLLVACPYVTLAMLRSAAGPAAIPSSVLVGITCVLAVLVYRTRRRSRASASGGPGGSETT